MKTFSALLVFCEENSPITGEFPHKGQWRGALMFSLIRAWTNGWANYRDAGDLRRHRDHYDVTVMGKRLSTHGSHQQKHHKPVSNWTPRNIFQLISFETQMFPFKKMHLKCRLPNADHFVTASLNVIFSTKIHWKASPIHYLMTEFGFRITHWGRMTHICVGKLTTIDSDNGLSPGRCQAIIWINAGILLIGPLGTNFNEILIGIQTFSFKKMHLKMSSAKLRPFCLGRNVIRYDIGTWRVHIKGFVKRSGRWFFRCHSVWPYFNFILILESDRWGV